MPEGDTTSTEGTTDTTTADEGSRAPDFTGDFDADRAKRLVENLRKENDALRAKLQNPPKPSAPAKPADKPADAAAEDPRVTALLERLEAADRRAAEAELARRRETVSAATGVPADLLSGDDEETMTKSADALIAWADSRAPVRGRPRARLVPGQGSDEDTSAFNPDDLAARIRG